MRETLAPAGRSGRWVELGIRALPGSRERGQERPVGVRPVVRDSVHAGRHHNGCRGRQPSGRLRGRRFRTAIVACKREGIQRLHRFLEGRLEIVGTGTVKECPAISD